MINFVKNLNVSKPKLSEKGFSLVEIMVAISIIGIMIVATVSQLKLSSKSATNMASDAEINNLTNKIITAIGTPAICSENFKNFSPTKTYTKLTSGGVSIVEVGTTVGTSSGEVKVSSIQTKKLSDNEMILIIAFQKKQFSLGTFFAQGPMREIPVNIVLQATPIIDYCFANYDLLVKTAIQQACKGNSAYYNATANPPYGQCEHNNLGKLCITNGQFLKSIVFNGTAIDYTCGKITADCPAGQVVTGYKADGTVDCKIALIGCAPGSVIVKNAAGQHVCTAIDCDTEPLLSGFAGFNPDGSKICTPISTTKACPAGQWATGTTADGTITCSTAVFTGGSCPFGQRIQGIKADGTPNCVKFINLPRTCPAGEAVSHVDVNGDVQCKVINRPLACDGTRSNHTYKQCAAIGSVKNPDLNTSHCAIGGSACPAGWTRCSNYGAQTQNSCTDTSNTYYCAGNVATRYAFAPNGNGVYGQSNPVTVQCYSWNGFPNTSSACFQSNASTATTITTQVGCY